MAEPGAVPSALKTAPVEPAEAPALAAALLPVLRAGLTAALAWGVFYRFATLFAMEPWLRGMNPSLYYTTSRLVQFWM